MLQEIGEQPAALEKTIAEEGAKLEGHKSLMSIKGIGKITSAILLSVIGDVQDFPDESRLASYFGIVPRVSNSKEPSIREGFTSVEASLGEPP